MATSQTLYEYAYDGTFQSRVLYNLVKVARDSFAQEQSDTYKSVAQQIIQNPRAHLEQASLNVVTNGSIAAALGANGAVSDNDIAFACTEYLNALAWRPSAS